MQEDINSILDLSRIPLGGLLEFLTRQFQSHFKIFEVLTASLSQKPVGELIHNVEDSKLVSILRTMLELIKSKFFEGMSRREIRGMLLEMFGNFSSEEDGLQHLIAVISLRVLLQIPTNSVTKAQDVKIEELKALFMHSLFDNDIVIYFMTFKDEQESHYRRCRCQGCNKIFILAIGWYEVAQEIHNKNGFVENSDFLVV